MLSLKECLKILADLPEEMLVKAEETFKKEMADEKENFEAMKKAKAEGNSCGLTTWDYSYSKAHGFELEIYLNGEHGFCLGGIRPSHIRILVEKVLLEKFDGSYCKTFEMMYK